MDIENTEHLLDYLEKQQGIPGEDVTGIQVLAGGVSNRTVLVQRKEGPDWVLKQALEKLRVADDWFSDPERIHREAEGMRVLKPLTEEGAIVQLVFEDLRHHIIAMEAVPEPHVNWKLDLLKGRIQSSLVIQFGSCLARIHRNFDAKKYPADGSLRDQQFFESLRVEPYYLRSAEQVPEVKGFIEELVETTRARVITVVHGDYSPKNILVYNEQIVLLDHEVIHIGDPAFDVGFSLTHFLSKANHLPEHRSLFNSAALLYWATYESSVEGASWASTLEPFVVSHTLACMLARVEGRSPLEYLASEAKQRQKQWCVQSMKRPPLTVNALIKSYIEYLNECL
ncbi:MAG: aminoglycoside phosphotransferase family protein [Rhodothermaceae bacterium]|nr:aminoglycoside phosphotransferase family protein [Rhodothermaceae bacterium]